MTNRLAKETSPYLRQHADNPVDWYPWGEEAFRRAQEEDKPILLSIGYSSCHWCHVMERECFEDPEIARLMNENFVCIKVDREELPDVDAVYMQAVQAMTGSGGWPLTVFLTPKGEPFFGGTYFPPEDRHGLPGFPRVLMAIAQAYREQREQVVRQAQQLTAHLQRLSSLRSAPEPLTPDVLRDAFQGIQSQFDPQFGGFGPAPKFPQPLVWEFVLRYHARTGDPQPLEMAQLTLRAMARGGIRDHLGGGFHRYSTDRYWLVPHFEKMLYDNALLARLYLHAYQATGSTDYRQVVEETIGYLLSEMRLPEGAFASAQDADSEGVEGKYYVWTWQEAMDVLGPELGPTFCLVYGVTPEGNWEGRNVLHLSTPPEEAARQLDADPSALEELLARARQKLLSARRQRVPPERDDKVLVSWNGLALSALAEAACALGRDDWRRSAEECARFLLQELVRDGQLMHTWKDGQAKVPAYLDDYACLVTGLLALHEATFDPNWLEEALRLGRQMVDLFWDPRQEAFYDTGPRHQQLVVRPRDLLDNAYPCGSSEAARALLLLATVSGDHALADVATRALRGVRELMARAPLGTGNWLCALDFYLARPKEVAIVGDPASEDTRRLLAVVYGRFLPNKVVVGLRPGTQPPADIPLLEGREALGGRATAYVCENFACRQPTTDPEVLAAQLQDS
ncbi:MAG: thioredoxin domain-containing protein [Dehalococcoidia bacterium]|jgi:uncharacterized protein YyaL (SSP411 family)|nr:thioredoxin domain-containing protein [Dehalococcoidia bacterium]MDW8009671.1 thioredoxin domain-containing protein [Chloroflexota bacterium]